MNEMRRVPKWAGSDSKGTSDPRGGGRIRPPASRGEPRTNASGATCSLAIIDCNAIIDCMASITIRNLEETTKRQLKIRAAMNGRSMEQEAREILKRGLKEKTQKPKTGADLAEAIRRRFAPFGGVELEPLPRTPIRDPDIR